MRCGGVLQFSYPVKGHNFTIKFPALVVECTSIYFTVRVPTFGLISRIDARVSSHKSGG